MKTPVGILLSRSILAALLALSPLGCTGEPPADKPPAVAQVGSPAAEPRAEGKTATNDVVAATPAAMVAEGPGGTNGPAILAEVPALSPALQEVVRLLQGGVGPDVIESFVTNSTVPFHVGAAELVYLTDLGAPAAILTALIRHDAQPGMQALKQVSGAAPAAAAVVAPDTKPAAPVPNPPEPTPVASPAAEASAAPAAPPPPSSTAVYQVAPETRPVTYTHFYTSLAPYGAWVDVPGYGHCWRPTVAVYEPAWRPYCDGGRWLWSDRGWYWYSSYSWGWAPFHYGRWCQPAGLGWVWVPSTCWGPAWVSWRYTTAGYCGWAPLPPSAGWVAGVGFRSGGVSVGIGFDFGLTSSAYVFCPTVRFCDPRPSRHCVPHHERESHYKGSSVINNYVVGNNNTIINQGIGIEKVAKVTKEGIRKVTVQDAAQRGDRGPRPERISDDGRVVAVARPLWASPSDRPVAVRLSAGENPKASSTVPAAGPRPLGLTGTRSPAVISSAGFDRPLSVAPAPAPAAVSAVKPVSSVTVTPNRGASAGPVGGELKPYSIRRGPAVDSPTPRVVLPQPTAPVVRSPAVSPSQAERPSPAPSPVVKGVTPGAPRPVALPSPPAPPSPSRPGAGSKVPVSSLSGGFSSPPSVRPSAPFSPAAVKPAPALSPASPARVASPLALPTPSAPRTTAPVASVPATSGRAYASAGPVAPRVSAPASVAPAPARGAGGGGAPPSMFSSSRSQGGRSAGGSDGSSGGKPGR